MRWDLQEVSWDERSKWWRREEAAVDEGAAAEDDAAAAARLRASSSSSLSSTLTSILVGFRLSISALSARRATLTGSGGFDV
ncbi:UNVERIFIED_CONTAM: hypothetical protein Sradi_2026400 [Sesamum radiatum]|uniref:Uncharacterized protein n=1 Tax=Sesamum radiatum TaxID=300843 RepID=A0AAW2TJK7_SESRA